MPFTVANICSHTLNVYGPDDHWERLAIIAGGVPGLQVLHLQLNLKLYSLLSVGDSLRQLS